MLRRKRSTHKSRKLVLPSFHFKWTDPWWCLGENRELQQGIQKELESEIGNEHPLFEFKPLVFGKCDANDDIVVILNDGRFALVHLTWSGRVDSFPNNFPSSEIYDTAELLQNFLDDDSAQYT